MALSVAAVQQQGAEGSGVEPLDVQALVTGGAGRGAGSRFEDPWHSVALKAYAYPTLFQPS